MHATISLTLEQAALIEVALAYHQDTAEQILADNNADPFLDSDVHQAILADAHRACNLRNAMIVMFDLDVDLPEVSIPERAPRGWDIIETSVEEDAEEEARMQELHTALDAMSLDEIWARIAAARADA